MSSMPPNMPPGSNMPPGGGQPPYGSYDPKTQWRVYREQQKAAWRAQRDAMKAQRYAAKAGYYNGSYTPHAPSIIGPVLLIGVGIVAFLVISGHLAASQFWTWYAHWWPLLLIAAGLALLGEWALDMRSKTPVRRGGSFVGIIVLLAIIGLGAAGWDRWWGPFRSQLGDQGDDFFNAFGHPEHDNDQQLLTAQVSSNAAIVIENPRGDVSITAGDGTSVEIKAHEVAFTDSDSDAHRIFSAEAARLTVSGSSVLVKTEGNDNGRVNLTVTVPKSANITVNAGHGDLTAAGMGTGLNLTAAHGDVHLSDIGGSVEAHFPGGRHDFSAHQVMGDLTIDGDINDLTLSEVKGKITQSGEILGDVHVENVGGPIHMHTSISDIQIASLIGDLSLNSDDLRVTEAKGEVRVTTHAKDVDLSQIYGDTHVEDRDGRVSIEPAGNYAVDAKNSKGDVEVSLPPSAAANVTIHTHNGDIVSDFPMPTSDEDNKSASFEIGGGGAHIDLSTDNGDVRLKKGSAFPAVPPPPPSMGAVPRPPTPPSAPHLRTPKALPAEPVTQ
jgi:DUF4097 and DUF4098 domain-containing protein YvlB